MKNQAICKFPSTFVTDRLSIATFVLENDGGTMANPVILKHHRLLLVGAGEGRARISGRDYPLGIGTLLFVFTREEFAVVGNRELEYVYIDFEGIRAEELLRRFELTQQRRLFQGFEGALPFFRESLSRASEENFDLVAESVLLYTFSRLVQVARQVDDAVTRVLSLVEEHFRDTTLTLESAAAELGYNAKYLSHRFKERMGVSFSEHLRTVRLGNAVFLIENGVESVKNVALLSGFADPLYFSSVFKKAMGVSPREYRNRQTK